MQFLINTVQKRGNTNAEKEIMQISQIMKNCDWLINVNRNIDQNQSGATPCWRETCILCFILFFVVNTFFFTFYFINVLDYFYLFIHCGLCFILLLLPRFLNIYIKVYVCVTNRKVKTFKIIYFFDGLKRAAI